VPCTGETSTTMPIEPGVLDANVLAYAVNADAPQHAASRARFRVAAYSGSANKYVVKLSRSFGANLYAGMNDPGESFCGSAKWSSTQLRLCRLEIPFKGGPIFIPTPFTVWHVPQ